MPSLSFTAPLTLLSQVPSVPVDAQPVAEPQSGPGFAVPSELKLQIGSFEIEQAEGSSNGSFISNSDAEFSIFVSGTVDGHHRDPYISSRDGQQLENFQALRAIELPEEEEIVAKLGLEFQGENNAFGEKLYSLQGELAGNSYRGSYTADQWLTIRILGLKELDPLQNTFTREGYSQLSNTGKVIGVYTLQREVTENSDCSVTVFYSGGRHTDGTHFVAQTFRNFCWDRTSGQPVGDFGQVSLPSAYSPGSGTGSGTASEWAPLALPPSGVAAPGMTEPPTVEQRPAVTWTEISESLGSYPELIRLIYQSEGADQTETGLVFGEWKDFSFDEYIAKLNSESNTPLSEEDINYEIAALFSRLGLAERELESSEMRFQYILRDDFQIEILRDEELDGQVLRTIWSWNPLAARGDSNYQPQPEDIENY